ncbi:P-loop containing nucleoside triphosphate hydrolase protein [Plectosphaerella plurivora]|uniref:P-loop containing nucleoside triphosphate hydrolase protein n=1 Tax=Plectosphaerella plurivora TaxID=936078 RepID=A0A9P8V948_9PEZI|nr:P-loop containing nucleoside triphosphate hydrolase protein [Plectosphaerella plurivora]
MTSIANEGLIPPRTTPRRATRTPAFADYLRVFTYATHWDFLSYAVASVASVGAGITLPLMIIVFGRLTADFSEYVAHPERLTIEAFYALLDRQALYMTGLFLGRWALNSVNKFCFRVIGIRLSSAVRARYLSALLALPIHVIDSMPAGAPATAITATSNTLQLGISERLGTFLEFTGTICAAIIVAFVWDWRLTLVTSSLVLYSIVVLALLLPPIVNAQTATTSADSHATAVASEALGGIRLVMACGAQSHVMESYSKWVREAKNQAHKMAPLVGLQLGLTFFGVFGAFGLAFWYGTQRFMSGGISDAGVVIVVLMSVMLVLTSVERISTPLIAVSKATVAACEFFAVIDAPLPPSGTARPDTAGKDLVFEGVTFEYPSRPGSRVLDNLSFHIQAGKNTALVGPSGSGKSTIVGLIERWYSLREHCELPALVQAEDPSKKKAKKKTGKDAQSEEPLPEQELPVEPILSGSVSVGHDNLEDFDLQWWRCKIGLVQQEPFLFNNTIFHNVANGLIATEWAGESEDRKRQMVREACEESYAHEFISRLPDGYDTLVGDGGIKLSGGQKQRIAIARSIIKKPQIMILDEATSAIDAKSERIVQVALDRVTRCRTTITIAHRLSTIQKADHIIVLQQGRAVEEGTHQSLMAAGGVYNGLVKAQSLRFAVTPGDGTPQVGVEAATLVVQDPDDEIIAKKNHIEETTSTPKKQRGLAESFMILIARRRAQWPLFAGNILAAMGSAAGTPIQSWLFAKVIGVFILDGDSVGKSADFWALMWLALASGVGLSYFAGGWIGLQAQFSVSAAYKLQYLGDMLHQRLVYFDQDGNSHGTLSGRVSGDAKQLEELLGMNLTFLASGIFQVIGCVIIALVFAWKLGLIALFITMPLMLASGWWKFRHEVHFDEMNSAVFTESSQFATEAIGAIRTVASLTMEESINDRYQQLLGGHVRAARRKAWWVSGFYGFADSVGLGCQALVMWYGGRALARGEYTLEAFFVCFMAIIYGAEGASGALAIAPNAAQAAAAASRILDTEESADKNRGRPTAQPGIPATEGGVEVELRNVSFKYPTRDVGIFDSLSLKIERGQYAAFVGPSGCGKTTIISLLERFYDIQPGHGEILCNGVNINDANVYDYRRGLSLVAQEPTMFRGTIRDNILFGISDPSSVSDELIHAVCRDAFIHDFIVSLPDGYATDVGQRGVSMSGGQKQRIAIARALIRDPRLLLLDEATSALDSESEKIVQAAFERAREGRTMIAVAHRLSTIQNADVIFVFDEGRVVEKGTHNELVQRQGVYWGMVSLSF